MTQEELDIQLQKLREEWKTATKSHRKLIEIRANYLKRRFADQDKSSVTYEQAVEIFKEN